jgi:hypothetical protein
MPRKIPQNEREEGRFPALEHWITRKESEKQRLFGEGGATESGDVEILHIHRICRGVLGNLNASTRVVLLALSVDS